MADDDMDYTVNTPTAQYTQRSYPTNVVIANYVGTSYLLNIHLLAITI